ncbi:MAG: TetR/AcrR family transcriptional regulator, partial [Candidatus Hydrogenedentota bacterium]
TMARIATRLDVAKATIYQHFNCKEEIIIALAGRSVDLQRSLVDRAATFQGTPRERMYAIGEATQLFAFLHPGDARIFQLINAEAITQKASQASLWRLRVSARETANVMSGIVRDAIARGDLRLKPGNTVEDITYQFWLMGESTKSAMWNWMPPRELGVEDPFEAMFHTGMILGDAYAWRPLSNEWDYKNTRRRIREEIFPNECLKAYGENYLDI